MSAAVAAPPVTHAGESPLRRAWGRLKHRKGAMLALGVLAAIVLLAVFAPLIAPHDPVRQGWANVRKGPSALFWFGTDEVGRDLFSRIIYGARASLSAGVVSVSIALLLGVPLGLLAGYRGGWIDAVISRFTDACWPVRSSFSPSPWRRSWGRR
jgi:peptide/nickel transport system permease protein